MLPEIPTAVSTISFSTRTDSLKPKDSENRGAVQSLQQFRKQRVYVAPLVPLAAALDSGSSSWSATMTPGRCTF